MSRHSHYVSYDVRDGNVHGIYPCMGVYYTPSRVSIPSYVTLHQDIVRSVN